MEHFVGWMEGGRGVLILVVATADDLGVLGITILYRVLAVKGKRGMLASPLQCLMFFIPESRLSHFYRIIIRLAVFFSEKFIMQSSLISGLLSMDKLEAASSTPRRCSDI